MNHLINQKGSVDDIRTSLKQKENHTTDDLWLSLRNERKNQNRWPVIKMLRTALRRQLHRGALLLCLASMAACQSPSELTTGELAVLAAYGKAEYRDVVILGTAQRIYYLDSTTVYTPCGQGWYCRNRILENLFENPTPDQKNRKQK